MAKLDCVHCGTYELTAEEWTLLRYCTNTVGIQCPRCNEEAKLVKFSVLVVHQFSSLPTVQQVSTLNFEQLCVAVVALGDSWKRPQVLLVDDRYGPPMASTVYRATEDGKTEVWKRNWDSSG